MTLQDPQPAPKPKRKHQRTLKPGEHRYKLSADNAWLLEELEGLGKIHATTKEVSAVLHVNESTLMGSFNREPVLRERYERGKEQGKVSLRRMQFALAKTSAAMAIFLGKNLFGQHDHTDHRFSGTVEVNDARERLAQLISNEAASTGKVADLIEAHANPE